MQTLENLARISHGEIDPAVAQLVVRGITLCAQEADTDFLFAALPGLHVHGASYAAQACEAGAVAVMTDPEGADIIAAHREQHKIPQDALPLLIVEDVRAVLGAVSAAIYDHPTDSVSVIGITGTSGKTTTTYLIEAALRADGRSVGLIGTNGSRLDGTAIPSNLTTPEAPDLQRLFGIMKDGGAHDVVMEVSSHSLCLGRVAGTHFAVGAFLNLSQDHLDFHHDMEEYFQAKASLFRAGSGSCCERAVICVDDEWGRRMAQVAGESGLQPLIVCTLSDEDVAAVDSSTREYLDSSRIDYWADSSTVSVEGVQRCRIHTPPGEAQLELPMPGRFNVANALVALAVCDLVGVPHKHALNGLKAVDVPGRLQRIDGGQDFLAVVDYAHKPAAVAAVIETLRSEISGRLCVVLGAGGDRDASKRPIMGREAARGANYVIITDDNPRNEDPRSIREQVFTGTQEVPEDERAVVDVIGDREEAIKRAVEWAQPGDAIIVAGKGHETGQKVKEHVYPFDDREVLREALNARVQSRSTDC